MKPEDKARQQIDKMLEDSGWIIQDYGELNLGAGLGVAVREFPISKDNPDYALFIDRQSVGVVEAKKVGWTLTGVTTQSEKYIDGLAEKFPNAIRKPPLSYETTGVETTFADRRDPNHRSRQVFTFHRPELLQAWLEEEKTLRARLKNIPKLDFDKLRGCQTETISNLIRKVMIQEATFYGCFGGNREYECGLFVPEGITGEQEDEIVRGLQQVQTNFGFRRD